MTETTPTTTNSSDSTPGPKSSAFMTVRVVLLLIALFLLLGILYFVWTIYQTQERGNYIISGEDLFRTGIIDRIVKQGPSQPAPENNTDAQGVQLPQSANTDTPGAPLAKGEQTYFIRTSGDGPRLTRAVINELEPSSGSPQAIKVDAEFAQPIDSIVATIGYDTTSEPHNLTLAEGTNTKGSWTGQWPLTGSRNTNYTLTLVATSQGQTSSVTLTFR